MGLDSQSKDPRPAGFLAGFLDRGTLVVIMQILSFEKEGSVLAKRIRFLWSAIYKVNLHLEVIESTGL